MNKRKTFETIFLIFYLVFSFLSLARSPKNLLNENTRKTKDQFQANNFRISQKQFQFILKNSEKVRFIITPPYYSALTAIGISSDGTAEKLKVLVYRLTDKQDSIGELLDATMDKDEYRFWELEDRAYHFMIEIVMLDSRGGSLGSYVELLHGFKDPDIPSKKAVEFKYHVDEGEKPTGKQIPPCLPSDHYGSCSPGPDGYIYRLEK